MGYIKAALNWLFGGKDDDMAGVLSIGQEKVMSYAVSIALSEAVIKGRISSKVADGLENRMNELISALYDGKALAREPDGTYTICGREEVKSENSNLVLGDDDD